MTKKPNLFINIVLAITLALIIVFGFLNLESKPKIFVIDLVGGFNNAEIIDQKIILHFSRPINKDTINNAISIEPEVEFETYWGGNDLYLKFSHSLESDSDYKLKVSNTIKDVYGDELNRNYEQDFHTRPLSFYYLQKSTDSSPDKIFLTSLTGDSQLVYRKSNIKEFIGNTKYLAVVVEEADTSNKLFLFDTSTKKETELDWGTIRVSRVVFSPVRNEFVALVETLELKNDYLSTKEGPLITHYNIDTKEKTTVQPDYTANYVSDVQYSPDGESLLYLGQEFYYITNLSDPSQTAPLDKFVATGGFNKRGDQLVFLQYNNNNYNPIIVTMDSEKNLHPVTDEIKFDVDPRLFPYQEKLVYAEQYTIDEPYIPKFEILVTDFYGSLVDTIKADGDSLGLPLVSPDERYLIMEKYSDSDLKDYTNQRFDSFISRPYAGHLVLYDLKNRTLLDREIEGINAVWL